MTAQEKAAGMRETSGAAINQVYSRNCSAIAKSTASEAQRRRILDALRVGPKTSYDLRRLGCYQSAARVLELRRQGYHIDTHPVTLIDRDGYAHPRAALYSLEGEPDLAAKARQATKGGGAHG